MEDKAPWFRRALNLNCNFIVTPFWEEMIQWPFAYSVSSDDKICYPCTFLVEGPNLFVIRVINFIGMGHVRSSVDRVIAICPGRIQGEVTIPGFLWGYFTHTDLGGVTLGCFCIGCSSFVLQGVKLTIPSSKCKQTLS